ncbi:MAG: non-ribosomal peptide synthetase [Burkholderiales bacterium]|nr:non-ribosomal peptide synthetase [Burkholderiales bacterium]MDQ3196898.1 non-ribosomal peptide synthetase [Pseudomonadota bacterium]
MHYSTLPEALNARRSPERSVTYIEGEQNERVVTLDTIYRRALGLLYHLQQRGAAPGNEVILLLNSNEQFIDAFWACLLGKLIPVPVAAGLSDEHRFKFFRILNKLNNPLLCTDKKNADRLSAFAEANELGAELSSIAGKTLLLDRIEELSRDGEMHKTQPDDLAFIQFSSGSTSEPKGVALTHRNLLTNIYAIIERIALSESDRTLSWMPLTHDMGLIGFHLTPLLASAQHYIMPTEVFIRRPQLWLQKASDKKANVLCSPNFGYKHFLKAFEPRKARFDLAHVRTLFNGAEPISVALCEDFLRTTAQFGLRRNAMYPVYGLAEASLAVTFPEAGAEYRTITVARDAMKVGDAVQPLPAADKNGISFVCVGSPVKDCVVRIADNDGIALPDSVIGRIQIAGGNVTSGYYNDSGATQAAFAGEWLDTGDIGFVADRELTVTGRAKEIIFVNGQNYFPHDLEALLGKTAGIELGKAAVCGIRNDQAGSDEILVFVLFRDELEQFLPVAKSVRKNITEHAGLSISKVIPVRRIPKTTSGKIQRYLLAESFANGEFGETFARLQSLERQDSRQAGDQTAVQTMLHEICINTIAGKKIGLHDNIFELGTSSLALAQIYEQIEKHWPGKLEITDFFDYPTIAELAAYLEDKLEVRLKPHPIVS